MNDQICWYCQSGVKDYFCVKCGRIQPIPACDDFFSYLGLERKLNLNAPKLERRFHTLSRLFHPDFFQRKSPEEQEVSLENSSVLNKAYRTLRDPISRLEYLIQLEKGDTGGIRAKAPPDLLEEVLELQEKLGEIRGLKQEGNLYLLENARGELRTELKSLENRLLKLEGRMIQLSGQWDDLPLPGTSRGGFVEGGPQDQEIRGGGEDAETRRRKGEILSEFRNILSHRTYIMNITEDIKKELS
ncbi:MAG: Fe-S protein assembly co-chaperone HscB [Nitrospirae bacterium]|nr:Fe-S protein assembly co-chaperone HscB [Nitrospirota bacterium]MBI3352491.1 Fe-S protein assembly co-chaperone HscB [Nitrospirota bacterium]